MTQPLRADEYILPESNVIELDGLRGPIETPAAVLANPDALAPPKKKAKAKRKKKATGKPRGRPASKVRAPNPVPESPPANLMASTTRIAPAGDGIVSRFPKLHPDDWRMIACVVGLAAAVASIALVIWW